MQVNRENFLHCLESVMPGLSPREILEQSACFVFSKGEVATFNDEISCRCPTNLDKKFQGAVKADPLLAILRKLPEEEIEIEPTDSELVITGKRRRSGIVMEKEIVLPVDQVEKPKSWTKLHKDFADAVQIVRQCAGRDESKFFLTCVHIHPKWLEACDTIQLCRWRMKTGFADSVLVRSSSVKHVTALGMTEFAETDSWVHFRNSGGLVLSCRRYLEDYLIHSEILKKEGVPTTLPKGLVEAADKANIFSQENTDNNQVTVELRPGKVTIKGQGISGWYRESKKLKYRGEPMTFIIAPELLTELVKRHNEVQIAPDYLTVDGSSYKYVACLMRPEEKNGEQE